MIMFGMVGFWTKSIKGTQRFEMFRKPLWQTHRPAIRVLSAISEQFGTGAGGVEDVGLVEVTKIGMIGLTV